MAVLKKMFNDHQILLFESLMDDGVTIDLIIDILWKFGPIKMSTRDSAVASVCNEFFIGKTLLT